MAHVKGGSLAGRAACPNSKWLPMGIHHRTVHKMAGPIWDTHVLSPKAFVCLHLLSPLVLFWRICRELAQLSAELYLDWWQERHSQSCMSRSKCHHLSAAEQWGLQGKNQCYLLGIIAWKVPRPAPVLALLWEGNCTITNLLGAASTAQEHPSQISSMKPLFLIFLFVVWCWT